ncbi:MAG: hypothetical protein H7223_11930 [Pedobacter sp.]|nr:hypothetical protein [Pedobacter sp.]
MKDELGFIKVVKVVLVFGAVIAFAIICYQMRSGFVKVWQDGAETSVNQKVYHIPVFENTIIPANDSLQIIGDNGFNDQLRTKYLVSGDVFNKTSPQKMLSFFTGFRIALAFFMVAFSTLLLLKLYSFIDDSSKGMIFTLENINRIKVIGGYCISLSITSFIWDLCGYFITKELFSHTPFTYKLCQL